MAGLSRQIAAGCLSFPLLAGCSGSANSETGNSEGNVDGASTDIEAVDVSIVDALAPYDAETSVTELLLFGRIQTYESAIVNSCLTDRGVPPVEVFEPLDREELQPEMPMFPPLDDLEQGGFAPLDDDDVWSEDDARTITFSDEQREARDECHEDDPSVESVNGLWDIYYAIYGDWYTILEEVDNEPEVVALRDGFRSCASDAGIAPEYAEDERAFLGLLDNLNFREWDSREELNRERRDLGLIYYDCGVELFERRVELRLSRRDEFVDDHWDDISELSEVLYSSGLIGELPTRG